MANLTYTHTQDNTRREIIELLIILLRNKKEILDGNMNRSLDRSMDRSMDEKLYSLIEANVQITNETIAELEGENEQFRNQVNTLKDKNAAINELLKQTRADNERLVARVNALETKKV